MANKLMRKEIYQLFISYSSMKSFSLYCIACALTLFTIHAGSNSRGQHNRNQEGVVMYGTVVATVASAPAMQLTVVLPVFHGAYALLHRFTAQRHCCTCPWSASHHRFTLPQWALPITAQHSTHHKLIRRYSLGLHCSQLQLAAVYCSLTAPRVKASVPVALLVTAHGWTSGCQTSLRRQASEGAQ